ncbi:MAG: hypothetical protein DRO10_03985 [Thermoprotei archaeon]|nr:MAG: hypothetical protein DRO10_03985 [Thermoprotei archaeon]
MGFEALQGVIQSITSFNVSGVSGWLAVIGFSIIVIVAIGYGIYGAIKLAKWMSMLRVKEFSLLLLAIGAALMGIAVALP